MSLRIGHAFDVHPFSEDPDRVLVLGGVVFAGETGLAGHSDADVIAHACTDAILSPAGLGDIGQLFPDTDPSLQGADSIGLLTEAVRQVRDAGGRVVNIDVTVVAERPKLAPRKAEMQALLTGVVGAPVTIKGKRAEGLGALGRAEGIAAWAVALVDMTDTISLGDMAGNLGPGDMTDNVGPGDIVDYGTADNAGNTEENEA